MPLAKASTNNQWLETGTLSANRLTTALEKCDKLKWNLDDIENK